MATTNRADSNRCDMHTRDAPQSQFSVIINTTDAPYTADIAQMSSVEDLCAFVPIEVIRTDSNDHHVTVSHANRHLSEVIDRRHAVNTLRHLNCLL